MNALARAIFFNIHEELNDPSRPTPTGKYVEHFSSMHLASGIPTNANNITTTEHRKKARKASGRTIKPHFSTRMGAYQFRRIQIHFQAEYVSQFNTTAETIRIIINF